MRKSRYIIAIAALFTLGILRAEAIDHPGATLPVASPERLALVSAGKPLPIVVSSNDNPAVLHAAKNLQKDFERVTGILPFMGENTQAETAIIIGTLDSPLIKEMVSKGKIDAGQLVGLTEKYMITTVTDPADGINEALVITGSDRRGVVYGIYEISEQIGVSPWYDWADVPVARQQNLSIARGTYTAGEPAVSARVAKGLYRVGDLQAWYGGGYTQAVLLAKTEVIESRSAWVQAFWSDLQASRDWVLQAEGATLVSVVTAHLEDKNGSTTLKAPLLTGVALAHCGIAFRSASESKEETQAFLRDILTVNQNATALPNDAFYYHGVAQE